MSRSNVIHLLVIREADFLTKAGKFSSRKLGRALKEAGLLPMHIWRSPGRWRAYAGPAVREPKERRP